MYCNVSHDETSSLADDSGLNGYANSSALSSCSYHCELAYCSGLICRALRIESGMSCRSIITTTCPEFGANSQLTILQVQCCDWRM